MGSIGLLIRIIGREGVIGECARSYLLTQENREFFIKGCLSRLPDQTIESFLGDKLITDMTAYINTLNKHF